MTKRRFSTNNLIVSIKKRKWCDVHNYLYEADQPDSTNTYALHQICSDLAAPIKIVHDIYHACPKAALAKDNSQSTPIYLAVDAGFEAAVDFLANKCPESCAIRGKFGSTPVQLAVYGSNANKMIDSIINASPKAAFIRDDEGDSAFDIFFRQWNVCMRIADKINLTGHGDWTIGDVCKKTTLFLKAANLYKNKACDNLLHCALGEESCYYAYCNYVLNLYPEQALKKDSHGNLPIHIICSSKELSDEETFLCLDCYSTKSYLIFVEFLNGSSKYCCKECMPFESCGISKSFEITPVKKVHQMVKDLIALAPQMVFIPNKKGSYPLHIAIHNQQAYVVVHEIFKALPEMRYIQDVKTKLLPFMLAAVGDWESEMDQISIIYRLLREDPHLILPL